MITNKQKEWLKKYFLNFDNEPHKTYIYLKRIQERIDHMLENTVWLAENAPWLLKDETSEIISIDSEHPLPRHRRLKKFIKILKLLYPEKNIWLELENNLNQNPKHH